MKRNRDGCWYCGVTYDHSNPIAETDHVALHDHKVQVPLAGQRRASELGTLFGIGRA
jgi:hypothetical protein